MHWPPNKAWTSQSSRNGFRHFVAINYGGTGTNRWINLVSVLDGNVRFRVSWSELQDKSIWLSGWKQLPREENIYPSHEEENLESDIFIKDKTCLHPSLDSGLCIPLNKNKIRPWFIDEDIKN